MTTEKKTYEDFFLGAAIFMWMLALSPQAYRCIRKT